MVALSTSDLTIPAGSFTVLFGPSSCGKIATLRLIAGLDSASSGRISFNDVDVTYAPSSQRGMSTVFQNCALFPHLSVAENIVLVLQVRKATKQEQSERLSRVSRTTKPRR